MKTSTASWAQLCQQVAEAAAAQERVQVQGDVAPDPWADVRRQHRDHVVVGKSARRLNRHQPFLPWAAFASTVAAAPRISR